MKLEKVYRGAFRKSGFVGLMPGRKVALFGSTGTLELTFEGPKDASGIAVCPVSGRIAVSDTSGAVFVYSDGGEERSRFRPKVRSEGGHPLWSPDGGRLLFADWRGRLRAIDPLSGDAIREANCPRSARSQPGDEETFLVTGIRLDDYVHPHFERRRYGDLELMEPAVELPWTYSSFGLSPSGTRYWAFRSQDADSFLDVGTFGQGTTAIYALGSDSVVNGAFSRADEELAIVLSDRVIRFRVPDLNVIEVIDHPLVQEVVYRSDGGEMAVIGMRSTLIVAD